MKEELPIGELGFSHVTGAVRIVCRSLIHGKKHFGIRDCTILGAPAEIAIERAVSSSNYSGTYAANKLVEGGYWSSKSEAKLPVTVEFKLSGRYHIKKLHFLWRDEGPCDYDTFFSEDGEGWYRVDTKQGLGPREQEAVIIGDPGYKKSTQYLKIDLYTVQPGMKYFGLDSVSFKGDLDLDWRRDAMSALEENLQALSPQQKQAHATAFNRPSEYASPSPKPSPKTTKSSITSSSLRPTNMPTSSPTPVKFSQSPKPGVDPRLSAVASIKVQDVEIDHLRDENERLKAELASMHMSR